MPSPHRENVERHPSYGLLRIGRISGGGGKRFGEHLFGSPITHSERVVVQISRARNVRNEDLHTDLYMADEELVEVELSPAQFADAITSFNRGMGTPCTIRYVGREQMPPCPELLVRTRLENEFAENMKEQGRKFRDGIAEVEEILQKKTLNREDRDKIRRTMSVAYRTFTDTVPFAFSQFNEVVDNTVREAKAEVDAFFTTMIHTAGMEALAEKIKPGSLSLE